MFLLRITSLRVSDFFSDIRALELKVFEKDLLIKSSLEVPIGTSSICLRHIQFQLSFDKLG